MDRVGEECLYNMVTLVILGVGTQWQAEHSEENFSKDPWVHILSFAMSRSLGTCQDDSNPRTLVPRLSLADIGSPFGRIFGSLAFLRCRGHPGQCSVTVCLSEPRRSQSLGVGVPLGLEPIVSNCMRTFYSTMSAGDNTTADATEGYHIM